jgi:hypothetical protein
VPVFRTAAIVAAFALLSACSSSPSAPESFTGLVIQPPAPVQPLADTFPHKRPTFTVTNVPHTGAPATLTYRFDVASDATFGNIAATGTVPEGAAQTSFTPSTDLVSGTMYYWRARASDTAKGVTGDFSASQDFTTINPDNGSFPYTLAVMVPNSCRYPQMVSVDGTLVVSADTLQFQTLNSLGINIARSKHDIVGTILGSAFTAGHPYCDLSVSTNFNLEYGLRVAASFSGAADNNGQLTGAFSGYAECYLSYEDDFHCPESTTPGYTWTLTPH